MTTLGVQALGTVVLTVDTAGEIVGEVGEVEVRVDSRLAHL